MSRVKEKIALVTGVAGGIGGAIARRLAENGAYIVATDIKETGAEALLDGLGAAEAIFIRHDVAEEESWRRTMEAALKHFGRLDILVNSAGIFSDRGQPFDAITLEEWRRIMRVNLDGTFLGTRAGVEAMKDRGGAIVNIASTAGHIGTKAGAAYGASKGGVCALTFQAAISCARHGYGIRINSISPGYVWTPAIEAQLVAELGDREAAQRLVASRNPLGRVAEPDDIAWAAVYLASDEARMVTATDLVIDGGMIRS
jgi:3(or 17)beta-hydroxysteroid dehydrogenase